MSNLIQAYRPQPFIGVPTEIPRQHNFSRYTVWLRKRFLISQAGLLSLAFLLLLGKAILEIIEFFPLAYLIDYLTGYRPDLIAFLRLPALASPLIMTSAVLTGALVLLILMHSLADTLAGVCLTRCGHWLSYKVRFAIFSHLNQQARTAHDQRQVDEILTRFIGDVSNLEDFVIRSCTDMVGNLLLLAGTLCFLAYYSGEMALLGVAIILTTALLSWHFTRDIQERFQKQRVYEDDLVSATQEMLTPMLAIQPYNRETYEQQRFAEYNQKSFEAAHRTTTRQAQFSGLSKVVEAVAIVAVLWVGLWLFNQASITIGSLVLMVVLSYNMIKPTREIIEGWSTIKPAQASIERISELLDNDTIFSATPKARPTPTARGFLPSPVENVTTPARPTEMPAETPPQTQLASKHFSLCLRAGETLAILNSPQTDTNLIIDLLTNLSATQDGQLWIGQLAGELLTQIVPLPPLDIMLQDPILFNGSVADNIANGCAEVTREQVIQAARQANAHSFIEQWPAGYDTRLGEQGKTLSNGQRQAIAIARAILHNAPILILDEPTAGLDASTGEEIASALRILMQGKTTIILSDDLALLNLADRVVKKDNGVWEEIGPAKTPPQPSPANTAPAISQPASVDHRANRPSATPFTLLHNPLLQQKLPALSTALDGEAMRGRLLAALIGPARSNRHYTIERCTPGQATYHDGECSLPYELEIQDHTAGQLLTPLVLARLFPSQRAAENYLRQRLTPLAVQMAGHPENAPFSTPCAQLNGLHMVVQVFPVDGALPALVALTDDQRMIEFFHKTLPEAANQRFIIEACTITILQYERGQRSLLQYQLDGRLAGAQKAGRQFLYGQVIANAEGELIEPALLALRRRMAENNRIYRFNLPHLLAYHPGLRLALFDTIPGAPALPQLLANRLAGIAEASQPALTLENALEDSARIASALHTAGIMLGPPHTLEDEFAELQAQIQAVWQLSPTLALRLQESLKAIETYAEVSEPLPLCFSHGAFTPLQPLFDQAVGGLLDFDTVCQAEPALDLGQFLAHLQLLLLETQAELSAPAMSTPMLATMADQFSVPFLQSYLIELGYTPQRAEHLHIRVKIYEATQLVRLVLRQWQNFQDAQLEQLGVILEERIATLPQVQHQDIVRKAPLHWLNGANLRKQQGWRQ